VWPISRRGSVAHSQEGLCGPLAGGALWPISRRGSVAHVAGGTEGGSVEGVGLEPGPWSSLVRTVRSRREPRAFDWVLWSEACNRNFWCSQGIGAPWVGCSARLCIIMLRAAW